MKILKWVNNKGHHHTAYIIAEKTNKNGNKLAYCLTGRVLLYISDMDEWRIIGIAQKHSGKNRMLKIIDNAEHVMSMKAESEDDFLFGAYDKVMKIFNIGNVIYDVDITVRSDDNRKYAQSLMRKLYLVAKAHVKKDLHDRITGGTTREYRWTDTFSLIKGNFKYIEERNPYTKEVLVAEDGDKPVLKVRSFEKQGFIYIKHTERNLKAAERAFNMKARTNAASDDINKVSREVSEDGPVTNEEMIAAIKNAYKNDPRIYKVKLIPFDELGLTKV